MSFLVDNVLHRTPLSRSIPFIGEAGERIAFEEQLPTLLKLLGVMGAMLIANIFSRMEQTRLLALIGEGVTLDLRQRFFAHLQRLPVSYHARTSATDLSQRFFTDIGMVPAALSTGLSLLINGIAMVMFGSTLLSLNLWLGLTAIAGLPFFALAARHGRAAMRQASRSNLPTSASIAIWFSWINVTSCSATALSSARRESFPGSCMPNETCRGMNRRAPR